jgi:hypothetical protein
MTEAQIVILVLQNLPLIEQVLADIYQDVRAIFEAALTGQSADQSTKLRVIDAVNLARARQLAQSGVNPT